MFWDSNTFSQMWESANKGLQIQNSQLPTKNKSGNPFGSVEIHSLAFFHIYCNTCAAMLEFRNTLASKGQNMFKGAIKCVGCLILS